MSTNDAHAELVTGPIRPGSETRKFRRFLRVCTWMGKVEAEGMGQGSPGMSAVGRSTVDWILDGIWAVADMEQEQFLGGKPALTWKAHLIAGWDVVAQEYRAAVGDSNGNLGLYAGQIEGEQFTLTSVGEYLIWGQPTRLRLIWDMQDPAGMKWRNEASVKGGPWTLVEEYTIVPTDDLTQGLAVGFEEPDVN